MRSMSHLLVALMLPAVCLIGTTSPAQVRRSSPRAATSQKGSDWTFPRKGMKSEKVDGRPVYSLGDGFAATLPRNSADGGQHALVIIAEMTVYAFVTRAEQTGKHPDEFLAYGIFYKVCKPAAGTAYLGPREVELKVSSGVTSTEYFFNTKSGATAHIYIAKDRSSAIVMIDPLGADDTNESSSADRPRKPAKGGVKNGGPTFEELRASYMRKHQADILQAFGTPYNTYDVGGRVAWMYRNLAYDPIIRRYKNVTIWFDKNGFVDRISE